MFFLIKLFVFGYLVSKSFLLTLFLIGFLLLPIIISYLLYKIDKKENIFKEKTAFILQTRKKLVALMSILFFIICFINQSVMSEQYVELFIYFYIAIMYFLSIIILYIQDYNFISEVKLFVNNVENFIKKYFTTNLFLTIIVFLFRDHSDIKLGFISSYVFFALTEVNEMYHKDKEKSKKDLKNVYSSLFILIVISSFYFTYFENIYNYLTEGIFLLKPLYIAFSVVAIFSFIIIYYVQKYSIEIKV